MTIETYVISNNMSSPLIMTSLETGYGYVEKENAQLSY